MDRFGYLPLILVAGLSLAAILIIQAAAGGGPTDQNAAGIMVVLALPLPLFLSVIWGWALMALRPMRWVLMVAAGTILGGALMQPGPMIWQVSGNIGAGLIAGWALQRRLRLDLALALCALVLTPVVAWTVKEVPVADQLALLRQDMTSVLEARIPASADDAQRAAALANEKHRLDVALDAGAKIYPMLIALGLLAQGGLIIGLVWFSARLTGGITSGSRFGSFSRLRLPFYLVWLLIAGVGMVLVRTEPWSTIGLNLTLLAGLVMSVHGLAVQVAVVGRIFSPAGRLVFWMVMGVFFAPLVMASGVLLGLADQWLDFRGLDRPAVDEDEKVV